MNPQRASRTFWRWIGTFAALILVAAVAWNAGVRVSQSPAPQPTMDPSMPGMTMSGAQAPAATAVPNAPTLAPTMPGMTMGNQQSPSAWPASAGQGSSNTAMPGMDRGSGLMQDEPVSSVGVPHRHRD